MISKSHFVRLSASIVFWEFRRVWAGKRRLRKGILGQAPRTACYPQIIAEHLERSDARNQMQLGGCLKALRSLESKGHFTLPKTQRTYGKKSPQRLEDPVPLPVDVPLKVGELQELKLILVQTSDEMRIWNELMIEEHPLGDGPLVGR